MQKSFWRQCHWQCCQPKVGNIAKTRWFGPMSWHMNWLPKHFAFNSWNKISEPKILFKFQINMCVTWFNFRHITYFFPFVSTVRSSMLKVLNSTFLIFDDLQYTFGFYLKSPAFDIAIIMDVCGQLSAKFCQQNTSP